MFDIKEYCNNYYYESELNHRIENIDEDLSRDIDSILNSRFDRLYIKDRFKHETGSIEIIHPHLGYPGSPPILYGPDKVRNLLSFYPRTGDFAKIDKIVIRPKLIEVGEVEMVGLYLRKKKILVMYLFSPHFYMIDASRIDGFYGFKSMELDRIAGGRLLDETIQKSGENNEIFIHPLWYMISMVSAGDDGRIEKFFIKKNTPRDKIYEILSDISFYYARHGY